MITKDELKELHKKVVKIAKAKYDNYHESESIGVELDAAGDFEVSFTSHSSCRCCSDDSEYIEVSYDELEKTTDEIIADMEEKKRLAKEAAIRRKEEQKIKDAKAKEARELAEFNRLKVKFNK